MVKATRKTLQGNAFDPAAGETLEWLIEQLDRWPTRVHPERTTSINHLMGIAAASLRAHRDLFMEFVEAAEGIDEDIPDKRDLWEHPVGMSITAGMVRKAAAIVSS